MRIVQAQEARERLTPRVCIQLMKRAFLALETGAADQPLRSIVKLPGGDAFGFMPAYLGPDDCFGAKVVTAFHQNTGTGYPSHMGYVLLFESRHGSFIGMADATVITERRTGAVSALATDLLARGDAHRLSLIGAGAQARSHLAAIRCVRDITAVSVFDLIPDNARRFAQDMEALYGVPVTVAKGAQACVMDADIVCTLTPSIEPFLQKDWIAPGTHINAVGTFSPHTREVTGELVAASRLYADYIPSMKAESGEYLIALREGLIGENHAVGSIGMVLLNQAPGRGSASEITLFDALGLAVEDIMCAKYLCTDIITNERGNRNEKDGGTSPGNGHAAGRQRAGIGGGERGFFDVLQRRRNDESADEPVVQRP